ncbi:hypothetical protein J5893_02710 [bacterium]|nr:hypothetical protein [bacterium]
MNTRDEYDASKRQSLAEIFFTELEITPAIGAMVNIPGIGTGEISKTEESEGNTYYIVDFNAPETYQNLNYMVQVIAINKA